MKANSIKVVNKVFGTSFKKFNKETIINYVVDNNLQDKYLDEIVFEISSDYKDMLNLLSSIKFSYDAIIRNIKNMQLLYKGIRSSHIIPLWDFIPGLINNSSDVEKFIWKYKARYNKYWDTLIKFDNISYEFIKDHYDYMLENLFKPFEKNKVSLRDEMYLSDFEYIMKQKGYYGDNELRTKFKEYKKKFNN